MRNADFRKQFGSTKEEMFSWNTLFYWMPFFLNTFAGWSQPSQCKEALHIPNRTIYKCQFGHHVFAGFYSLRCDYTNRMYTTLKVWQSPKMWLWPNVDVTHLLRPIDDESSMEELETCKHLSVESEMHNERQRVSIYAMQMLDGTFWARI